MTESHSERLSPIGPARREAMLGELIDVMQHAHRARRTRRRVLAVSGGASAVLLLLWLSLPGALAPERSQRIARNSLTPNEATEVTIVHSVQPHATLFVHTDASVLERYRVKRTADRIVRLDDSALLEALASINRPAGLIRHGNSMRISTPVTDQELGLKASKHRT